MDLNQVEKTDIVFQSGRDIAFHQSEENIYEDMMIFEVYNW
jgi:hypothetical protein